MYTFFFISGIVAWAVTIVLVSAIFYLDYIDAKMHYPDYYKKHCKKKKS